MLSVQERREIAGFLKARRQRVQPSDVGLPPTRRRRTSGLRREEVAQIAAVSVEWYTRLEQARDVRASRPTLRGIGRALKLEPTELDYLFRLSGHAPLAADSDSDMENVSPRLRHVLDELVLAPAYVVGRRWDILAWNRAYQALFGDLSAIPALERNCLYQMYLAPLQRSALIDWEDHARRLLAGFRSQHAGYLQDPWFGELIEVLRERSPEFVTWWSTHDVGPWRDGAKHFDHPRLGRLSFEHSAFDLADDQLAGMRLITYVPLAGTDTRDKLYANIGEGPSANLVPTSKAVRT